MSRAKAAGFSILIASLVLGGTALAQWPTDPAVNLAIADGAGEQILPKVATTPDGGCYVGWFDNRNGAYEVYLQHLNVDGFELWAHNGILVSDHTQLSSLVDWDLTADTDGAAVLVFTDARDGSDLDVFGYRIGGDGAFLWGPDGITLSSNDDYEPSPVVTQASDGDLVFLWARLPDSGGGSLMMQRVTPAGTLRFAAGGLAVLQPGTEKPGFAQLVPADDGSVICSYVRDIGSFLSPRHVHAARFAADGSVVWGPVAVYDATSVPIAHWPREQADGMGGAVICWHSAPTTVFNSYVQHLDADGNELWAHNGVTVSTSSATNHLDPALAYNRNTGETFVAWNERNTAQSQWGILAQKFDTAGARQWGGTGAVLLPVDATYKSYPRAGAVGDGCMVFYADEPGGGFNQDRLLGMMLDGDGNQVWPGSPILVSSVLSSKSRLPLAIADAGNAIILWEDSRNGTPDVYGQSVNIDGTLGVEPVAVEGGDTTPQPTLPDAFHVYDAYPNPFNPLTTLAFDLPVASRVEVRVYDVSGRLVRTLLARDLPADHYQVRWDGTDDTGRRQPSGGYLFQVRTPQRVQTRTMMMVK